MKHTKDKVKTALKNIGLVISGTLVLALGAAIFVIPYDIVSGGIVSIAILIERVVNIEFLTVDRLVAALTWSLFVLGFLTLGKSFALKSLVASLIYPPAVSLFSYLSESGVLGGVLSLEKSGYSAVSPLLAALFGAVFIGVGCALTFLGGGSTGGVDIIAFVICKRFPRLKSSSAILIIDAVVIFFGIFILGDLVLSLLGVITASLSVAVIDRLFLGSTRAFMAQIITKNGEIVSKEVISRLGRSVSIVDVVGGYSGEKKKMLLVTFTAREYRELMSAVLRADRSAFVSIHGAHQISGNGWGK